MNRLDVFKPQVNIGCIGFGGITADQDTFNELMRIFFDEVTIVERGRFTFVAIDAHERFFAILREKGPLQAGRETGTTTSTKFGGFDKIHHIVGRHRGEGLT